MALFGNKWLFMQTLPSLGKAELVFFDRIDQNAIRKLNLLYIDVENPY